jgi:hypothetical protein
VAQVVKAHWSQPSAHEQSREGPADHVVAVQGRASL